MCRWVFYFKYKGKSSNLQVRGFVHILSNIFLYLSDMQNVSEYHAAIDGASLKLVEKSERLSLADRELVQRADDHAENLDRQANELEE